ncbi:MAG TPA: L-threonylcarbamoyladenylate synthase [Candidatus Dormibacteraeota bacterium]|nr:L-threonylcarbamoyladenylate synthase [Candidatus Dormibacteraeota bacterium]
MILRTDTPELFVAAVGTAAELLRNGEVVALPTETVYGLAANALKAEAVAQIYELKGRPAHNPIIVHVASWEMARSCADKWPEIADKLGRAFWPGPLTMVLPRAKTIPDIVTAGGATVGIRWPSHPFMQAVIHACGFPLAAPSANLSNQLSPTNAEHVAKAFGGSIPLIVDGGQCQVGIESTVLDITSSPPRVLRPGMIHEESLVAVTGEVWNARTGANFAAPEDGPAPKEPALRSPGMLQKHYSPKARLVIWNWRSDAELREKVAALKVCQPFVIAHTRIPSAEGFAGVSLIPHDPEAFARAIYAELHRCDEGGADWIIVEELPEGIEWQGIADRLRKAAA